MTGRDTPDLLAEIDRLRADNERMRAALEDVLPYARAAIGLPEASWPADSVILRARAALAETARKGG